MVILTVWHAGLLARALPMLRAIRPHAVMLHSSPEHLASVGAKATAEIRADASLRRNGEAPAVWFGVAGDVGHTATHASLSKLAPGDAAGKARILRALQERRLAAVRGAKRAGVGTVMWDPEAAWKLARPGFDAASARELLTLARTEAPEVRQLVTSYDCPTYHHGVPWAAWDDADGWAPQIYAAPAKGEPPSGSKRGRARHALHRKHWTGGERERLIRPRPYLAYVQAHHVETHETTFIADQCADVALWCAPTRIDAAGILAARALVAIEDAGFAGPGRVRAFQTAHGLTADSLVGPKTLAALRLS